MFNVPEGDKRKMNFEVNYNASGRETNTTYGEIARHKAATVTDRRNIDHKATAQCSRYEHILLRYLTAKFTKLITTSFI
jgi:hypothetical protein